MRHHEYSSCIFRRRHHEYSSDNIIKVRSPQGLICGSPHHPNHCRALLFHLELGIFRIVLTTMRHGDSKSVTKQHTIIKSSQVSKNEIYCATQGIENIFNLKICSKLGFGRLLDLGCDFLNCAMFMKLSFE